MNKRKEDSVLIAIDKDKGSQYALKWAVDNLLHKNQLVTLFHVNQKPINSTEDDFLRTSTRQIENARELFLPFRCFCTRKELHCNEVLVEDTDTAKAILNYVTSNAIEILILGAPARSAFVRRFKANDLTTNIQRTAPEFCTVYIIAKNKVSSVRAATGPPPQLPKPVNNNLQNKPINHDVIEVPVRVPANATKERHFFAPPSPGLGEDVDFRSPLRRMRATNSKQFDLESDISFVSSGRPSIDRMLPYADSCDYDYNYPISNSDFEIRSIGSSYSGNKSVDMNSYSSISQESLRLSSSYQAFDDDPEIRRLKLQLKQTIDLYNSACKEALTEKQKTAEFQRWKITEQQKLDEARMAEEAALALVEKEKAKSKAAIQAAEAAQKLAALEAQKRKALEKRALVKLDDSKPAVDSFAHHDLRYRKYTLEEIETATHGFLDSLKIGEGGYGPVYKCYLDHTPVAVKVLRPDAAQGKAQFHQEVEVLSCIRHPNLVLLLGACPEYGCLVYEFMANGSLEDRLLRRGNSPVLSWQNRFRISAEIATGLLFLHQTKPEPLVHRDLKPGNILLDRNLVSKISDVGLARLVPPSVANNVTQYRMTATAGTFCYIDPEYQQTGMLGIKSDIYSLGIMLLQIITAKPPMGVTHQVERALERGTLAEVLDPAVTDWPMEETTKFAIIALQCAELRRKDRPDLGNVVLRELNRMRALAEGDMQMHMFESRRSSFDHTSTTHDVLSDHQSSYDSSTASSFL